MSFFKSAKFKKTEQTESCEPICRFVGCWLVFFPITAIRWFFLGGGKSKRIFFGEEKSTETSNPMVFAVKTFQKTRSRKTSWDSVTFFQEDSKTTRFPHQRCVLALRDERHEARETRESKWSLDWSGIWQSLEKWSLLNVKCYALLLIFAVKSPVFLHHEFLRICKFTSNPETLII